MGDNGEYRGGSRRKDAIEPTDLDEAFDDFGVPDPPAADDQPHVIQVGVTQPFANQSGTGQPAVNRYSADDQTQVFQPIGTASQATGTTAQVTGQGSAQNGFSWQNGFGQSAYRQGGQAAQPRRLGQNTYAQAGQTAQVGQNAYGQDGQSVRNIQNLQNVQNQSNQNGFSAAANAGINYEGITGPENGNGSTGDRGRSGGGRGRHANHKADGNYNSDGNGTTQSHGVWTALGILAEILFTIAAVCALYIVWQLWWTGVQSEHTQYEQSQSVAWSDPSKSGNSTNGVNIAKAQDGTPPIQPKTANTGDMVAQIYIPRFGDQWQRNIVQGTDTPQLNTRGMGHYTASQMPGEMGNFAVAGHRDGYGQPLGDIDKLQPGDPIILRTQDYWYVFTFTSYKVVTPDHVEVVAPNPENPTASPTKRMITLTTCTPKYATPTHRWISYGEFKYWAKVSDGVPQELTHTGQNGKVQFINNKQESVFAKLPSLVPIIIATLIVYLVLFIAAAIAWRWPLRRAIKEGSVKKPDLSIYGGLTRLQPGIKPIRILLLLLLLFAVALSIMQWACPWAAANIPILHQMSNYVAVTN